MRAAVLEGRLGAMPAVGGGAREGPIDLEPLQRADAVLLSCSLAGPDPARLVWEGAVGDGGGRGGGGRSGRRAAQDGDDRPRSSPLQRGRQETPQIAA